MKGDTISRKALLNKIDELIQLVKNDDQTHHAMCVSAAYIEGAHALDVTPVIHARWKCECEPYHVCSACDHI